MTPGKDAKHLERAETQLHREHQPRHDPRDRGLQRISLVDEQAITDEIRRHERQTRQATRSACVASIDDIAVRVQTLRDELHADKSTSRGARDLARRVARDLRVLKNTLEGSS